jgi:hypothetical protein
MPYTSVLESLTPESRRLIRALLGWHLRILLVQDKVTSCAPRLPLIAHCFLGSRGARERSSAFRHALPSTIRKTVRRLPYTPFADRKLSLAQQLGEPQLGEKSSGQELRWILVFVSVRRVVRLLDRWYPCPKPTVPSEYVSELVPPQALRETIPVRRL